ncbi:unnamed protein product [Coregonus sp. 'balchen']|nr:unnamed protein product [Coregonus sp. 'balchen']
MRILVTLLLDTLPMLGNVLLLCFFVFFIFGIVGVQLWAGLLRNRCFLPHNFSLPLSVELGNYYHTENDDESPFICSMPRENGMRLCSSVPTLYEEGGLQCQVDMNSYNSTDNTTCVNWNQYYSNCSGGHVNPFKGAINFDNICYAWIAIFQIGSFFMINLCLVVIATQFSETKQRESQLMREQRIRFLSNASTLASFSEPGSCYDELLKLLVHVIRNGFRQVAHVCRAVMRRAGMNIAASPPALERERERGSQRKRRKASRQGSVVSRKVSMSVHYLVHQNHHHHYHYHLVNGSVRGRLGGRGVAGVGGGGGDVETGSHSNNGGTGRLMLGPPPLPTSDVNLATPVSPDNPAPETNGGDSSSVRSTFHTDCHLEPSTPTALAPTPSPFSLTPTPMSRPMKRNSVPFAGSGPKNYPTLQPRALMESRSGSVTASTISNINLNIPPLPLERRSQSFVDTHTPTAQLSCRDLSAIGTLDPSFTFDPESCPYCAKALAGESEGTDGNETPGDSDSEGIYEFTPDLQHRDRRDRRDSRQPRKRQRKLGTTVGRVVRAWRLVCDTFRKIVDSKYFGRGIMIAILINTLSMGIEYHEQTEGSDPNALEQVGFIQLQNSSPTNTASYKVRTGGGGEGREGGGGEGEGGEGGDEGRNGGGRRERGVGREMRREEGERGWREEGGGGGEGVGGGGKEGGEGGREEGGGRREEGGGRKGRGGGGRRGRRGRGGVEGGGAEGERGVGGRRGVEGGGGEGVEGGGGGGREEVEGGGGGGGEGMEGERG